MKEKTVYGPYKREDGREHVIIYENGKRKTVSYPKWLMEQKLGRELDPNLETIDHIDGDFTNNSPDNLRILPRSQHISEDATRVEKVKITCVWCGEEAYKRARDLHSNAKKGKAGPFCSKSCGGEYGAEVQNGRVENLPAQEKVPVEKRIYYKTEKKV